jgi:hypothetical protein
MKQLADALRNLSAMVASGSGEDLQFSPHAVMETVQLAIGAATARLSTSGNDQSILDVLGMVGHGLLCWVTLCWVTL